MLLEEFNALDRAAAIASLRPCIDVQRWCEEIADARPFASRAELLEAAEGAARPFTAEEIEAALVHHPRIGERAGGGSKEATLSTRGAVRRRPERRPGRERSRRWERRLRGEVRPGLPDRGGGQIGR